MFRKLPRTNYLLRQAVERSEGRFPCRRSGPKRLRQVLHRVFGAHHLWVADQMHAALEWVSGVATLTLHDVGDLPNSLDSPIQLPDSQGGAGPTGTAPDPPKESPREHHR